MNPFNRSFVVAGALSIFISGLSVRSLLPLGDIAYGRALAPSAHEVGHSGAQTERPEPLNLSAVGEGAYAPLFISNEILQGVAFVPGARGLTFYSMEAEANGSLPIVSGWTSTEYVTAYDVKRIVPAGKTHEFYVVGRGRNGDELIERWTVEKEDGERFAYRSSTVTPTGVPISAGTLVTGVVGGVFVPVAQRGSARPLTERTEIYRGSSLGKIYTAAVDPDGRFVLMVAGDALYRLDLLSGGVPAVSVELDSSELPSIGLARHLFVRELDGVRCAVLACPDLAVEDLPGSKVILWDQDNDGFFELPPALLTYEVYAQRGLNASSGWSLSLIHI